MRTPLASSLFVGTLSLAFVAPLLGAGAAPAPGSATGALAVAGKSVPLTHAIAFNAGARIYLLITDQALPPAEVSSEFKLAMYQFTHHVTGLELTLDSTHKVIEVGYRWEQTKKPCTDCFTVTLAGGPGGPLTGSVKATPKGEASEKMKADVTFNAPFAPASGAKPPAP
jgi:hypothetical protein